MSGIFLDLGIGNDAAVGTDFNDTILGNAGNDTIGGFGGDDSLLGGDDNDFINGGNGADTLDGGNGNDLIMGGDGTDRIFGGNGNDSIDAGAGAGDLVAFNHTGGQAVSATISAIGGSAGGNYAIVTSASQGNDTIINFEALEGSRENDGFTINSAATDNAQLYIYGGIGADTIAVNIGNNSVLTSYNTTTGGANFTRGVIVDLNAGTADDGRGGIDSLIGVRGVNGSSFGDTILGSIFNDRFRENGGSDSINGRDGFDLLDYSGSSASQPVSVNLAAERASDGRGGTDTVISMEYVWGGEGNDTIIGNAADNELRGGSGNDTILGGNGADTLDGGNGDDALRGETGADLLIGGAGNDTLNADVGTGSRLIGGEGNDWLTGAPGSADTLDGGNGLDVVFYENASGPATIDLGVGIAFGPGLGTDVLIGVENVHGTHFADSILGTNADGYVFGRAGNDTIRTLDGSDNLIGGSGNDLLDGGEGSDRADYRDDGFDAAGAGTRGVIVNISSASVVVGADTVAAGTAIDNWGHRDTLISIGVIRGSDLADTLIGGSASNRLFGGAGNDWLDGGADSDIADYANDTSAQAISVNLIAGRASDGFGSTDTLISIEGAWGGAGNDTIIGNNADNELRGGSGADILDGGASGFDIADYANNTSAQAISVNLTAGRASDGFGLTDTLVGIEYVRGGSGNDTMIGSDANERFRGNAGNDTIDGGGGTEDILDLSSATGVVSVSLASGRANDGLGGNDSFVGIEVIYAGTLADTLIGGSGNDIFDGGMGGDLIDGGLGADRVRYWVVAGNNGAITRGVSVDLAAQRATDGWGGQDTLIGIERVTGTDFNDTLLGDNVSNRFNGRNGSDSIDGGLSSDWLEFVNTADTAGVTVNLTTGTATDGAGATDRFTSIENVVGGSFGDHLTGIAQLGRATSRLRGGGGNDTLVGIEGQFVIADYSDQTVALSVNLASGSANDGLGGIDSLVNIRGAIMYGNFADTIIGTAGNDWLSPSGGNDTIVGGNGFDILGYDGNPTGGVSVNLAAGTASDGDGGTDIFSGIEGVAAGYSNDTVIGDGGDNIIALGAGADYADAAGGRDTISATLGSSPNTQIYTFNEAGNGLPFTGVTIDLAAGRATDQSGATDTILNFEAAIGSTMHDSILGSNGNDVLDGAEGNDTISGGDGGDTIYAGVGDVIYGGTGDDVVLAGNRTLADLQALFGP